MSSTRARPPRGNWNISQRNADSDGLYALSLIDLRAFSGSIRAFTRELNQQRGALNDVSVLTFAFKVNPKSMDLDEPAAVTITPTQNGGQHVEHQGQIYKNIHLAGTTGLRPNRSTSGALIPIVGIANPFATFDPDPETGLPRGERTGFDDLIDLRNVFRHYYDLKEDADAAPNTLMVWQNGKEGEYYVVEPITFKTARDASSPVTFNYDIQLRTIERLDITQLKQRNDSYAKRNGIDTFFQRLSDIRRELTVAFSIAQAFVDRTATIAQATVNEVLTPVNTVIQSLTGVITSGRRFFDIPQNSLSFTATNATELATALDNLPNNAYVTDGIGNQIAITSNAYKKMARALYRLAAESQLFSAPISTTVSAKQAAYRDPVTGMPLNGGSPTNLGNVALPNASAVAEVYANEDIRGLAQRLLGDAAQWKILVLLNNLKQPYVSASGDGINVLRPGDQIVYPRAAVNAQSNVAPTTDRNNAQTIQQRLGRDLLLRAIAAAAGEIIFDLASAPTGDLASVEGMDNMSQALNTKFATEQGELPTHPFYGIRYPFGTKAVRQSLIAFQINARATLLSDNRIADVANLLTTVEGNVLRVRASIALKGSNESLAYDFSTRR